MKIVGIADEGIVGKYIEEGFAAFKEKGCEIETVMWESDHDKVGEVLRITEKQGAEAVEVPNFVCEAVKDADIIITQFCPINKKVIDAAPKCRVVGVCRAGIENVNLPYATEKGILVYNTLGRNADAVADLTVAGLLAEVRNVARGYDVIRSGGWRVPSANAKCIPDIPGKTLGVIGFGEIGSRVAKRLGLGFGMNVLVYDPYYKGELPEYARMTTFEDLMKNSDLITIHVRLTDDTYHLISKEMIDLMKPTAVIANVARSGLIDNEALYDALVNKRIMGAFIDVWDEEPTPKDYPLVMLDNVTASPHRGGGTLDARTKSPEKLAAEMVKLYDGEGSRFIKNPQVLPQILPLFKA